MNTLFKRYVAVAVSFALTINPALAVEPPQLSQLMAVERKQAAIDNQPVAKNNQAVALAPSPPSSTGIVLDPAAQASIKQAANGTTVIDIATPTAKGVSRTQFSEFNVDQSGVIFNNSAAPVLTQLGGWADGNRRLAGGEASVILSEVTGTQRSSLLGQIEIAGKSAAFVLANANGITCDGCGFINTPRVSLVTGNPVWGSDGNLGFDVAGGSLVVEGAGLNASTIDRFDIVTRSAQINAAIYAQELNFYTGSNHYDYNSSALTAINPSAATVQFALDSSALGGMYANSIRLVGTEKGVGVNTQGLIQSVTDLELTADGDIRVKDALAGNKVQLASTSGDIAVDTRVYGKEVSLAAGDKITNTGLLAAENSIALAGRQLDQQGDIYAGLATSGTLLNSGKLSASFTESMVNQGTIYVGGDLQVSTSSFTNNNLLVLQSAQAFSGVDKLHNQGQLQFNTQGDVSLAAKTIDNSGGEISLTGNGLLSLASQGELNNSNGTLSAVQGLQLNSVSLNNTEGLISAGQVEINTGDLNNTQGLLQGNHLTLNANALNNHEGAIYSLSKEAVAFTLGGSLDNSLGIIYSNASVATISADQFNNHQGAFVFKGTDINLALQDFSNQDGIFQTGNTEFSVQNFDNSSGEFYTDAFNLTAKTITNNAGFLQTGSADIQAENYLSHGGVLLAKNVAGSGIVLTLAQQLDNTEKAVIRSLGGDLQIAAKQVTNSDSAITLAGNGNILLVADSLDNQRGNLTANNQLQLNLTSLQNSSGTLQGAATQVTAKSINNTSGVIQAMQQNLIISADEFNNTQGITVSAADAALTIAGQFTNREGALKSLGRLQLNAAEVSNNSGEINSQILAMQTQSLSNISGSVTAGEVNLSLPELNNSQGVIAATKVGGSGLQLAVAGSLNNTQGTLLSQGTQLQLNADQLNNTQGNIIAQTASLDITSKNINNTEGLFQAAVNADIHSNIINNVAGTLLAGNNLTLVSSELDNRKGLLLAKGSDDNSLRLAGQVNNTQGRLETFARNLTFDNMILNNQQGIVNHLGAGTFTLTSAGTFNNQAGIVQSEGTLLINATGANSQINNQAGLLSAKRVDLSAEALIDNSNKGTIDGENLVLSAAHISNAAGYLVASGSQSASISFNTSTSIDNRAGELRSSARDWTLNLDLFDNTQGTVAHTGSGSLILTSDRLLSNSGIISSKADLLVNAKGVANSGQFIADKNLTFRSAADILNSDTGLLKAGAELQIAADGFNLHNQGEISAATGLTISLAKGIFNNSGDIISSGNAASLTLGSLNNSGVFTQNGTGTLSINADHFINSNTLQATQGSVVITAADFANSGILSAHQLQLGGIASGSNSQRIEADQLTLSGKTFSNSGTLAAIGEVDSFNLLLQDFSNSGKVSSNSLNLNFHGNLTNSGTIEHAGSGSLLLGESGSLNDTGSIATAGIAYLLNEISGAGEIFAKLGIVIEGANFTNQAATLYTQGDMTISSALNNGGKLLADGKFSLITNGAVNNSGGTLQGSDLIIAADSLKNTDGVITSTGVGSGSIKTVNAIDNHSGSIATGNSEFTLSAGSAIDNSDGSITQKNTAGQMPGLLILKAVSQIDNSQGTLISEGKLDIDAGNLLLNRQAKNLASDSLNLKAVTIDNSSGKIEISGSGDSSISAQDLNNTQGEITANSDHIVLNLAGIFNNTSGQINHSGLKNLSLTAVSMNTDASSKLLSNGNLALELSTNLDNKGEIGTQLNNTIKAHTLTNSGTIRSTAGQVDLQLDKFNLINSGTLSSQNTLNIYANKINNSGSVGAENSISITVNGFDGVGNIVSNNSLTLTLVESLVLQATESLIAPNSLKITTQGGFDNAGTLSAANDLQLIGNYLNNATTGKIIAGSGDGSSFTIAGDILNQGLISVQQSLAITAANLTNDKNATIVTGGKLSFDLNTVDPAKSANFVNRGVIYAVGNLDITQSDNIANEKGAILFSGNAMELHTAGNISNDNGRIESSGNMTLQAALNIQNGFETPILVITPLPGKEEIVSSIYNGSNNGAMYDFIFRATNIVEATISDFDTFNSIIFAGNNLTISASDNSNTSADRGKIINHYGSIVVSKDLSIDGTILTNSNLIEKTEETIVTRSAQYAASCVTSFTTIDPGCTAQNSTAPTAAPTTTEYQRSLGRIHVGEDITGSLGDDVNNVSNMLKALDNKQSAESPDSLAAILVDGSSAQNAGAKNGSYTQAQSRAINAARDTRKLNSEIIGDSSTASNGSNDAIAGAENSTRLLQAMTLAPGSDLDESIQQQIRDLPGLLGKANPLAGATLTAPVVSFSVLPINFNLNNLSGLYIIAQSPSSHYLIETRPEFTSFERFIGSDYLLAALGYDPEDTIKRLGDAFFETQLVKDALMAEATTRYLDGESNDFDQMQHLMDNAVNANKNLQLTLGVELTPEQAAALTQDMIWMVQKKVNGEKVLVPQLYLTSVSQDKLNASKAAIGAGGSINLAATGDFLNQSSITGGGDLKLSTKGNFSQTGVVVARGNISFIADQVLANSGLVTGNAVTMVAQDSLTNSGKVVAQSDLILKAKGDIRNQQGTLEGNDVSLTSTEGNIINRTEFTQTTRVDRQGRTQTSTEVGPASTIISHNSLTLDAGKSLDLQGSQFAAANDINFAATEDILLNAIENKNARDSSTGKHSVKNNSTEFKVVDIKAGGNLSLNAGRDLVAQGSQLSAGADASLTAGRDINLTAVANTHHSEDLASRKKEIDTTTTHTLVAINSGGDTQIRAAQDANLTGVAVDAGGDVSLGAKRDTNVTAVLDSDYHYDSLTKKKSFGRSKTTTNETLTESVVGGTINSGGDLLINAHKNAEGKVIGEESGTVNLAGVSLAAKNDVAISADEDVNITGMNYETLDYHQTKKSGALGLSKKDKGTVENASHLQNASIQAGGNAHVLSGADIKLAATNVVVDGDINLQAVDSLLLTAGEAVRNSAEWNNKSAMLSGDKLYSKSEHKAGEGVTEAQASNLVAGGKVTANAGTGQVIGSNISGDKGVSLISDTGDFDILAAKTTTQAYSRDKSTSVGLGDLAKGVSRRPDQMVKNEEGRATIKFADAQYDSVESKSTAVDMQGSNIESQKDVTVIARAGKVNVQGSTLAADTDHNQEGTLGLAGATGVSITETTNTYESESKEVHGSAEMSVVVQHQAAEVVKAVLAVEKAKDQVEKAKKDYKAYERNLDQLETQLGQLESDYTNKVPGVVYDDLLELREIIKDCKDDKEWYLAGMALAAVNLTSSITALVQQTVAAVQSTGTYGFNAGVQLDIDASKSKSTDSSTTAQASNLSGNNILIQTGTANADGTLNRAGTDTTIKGSNLFATNGINIQTGELNLLNSKDTSEHKNETEHGHITAQMTIYGASGGASISGSFDRSKDSNASTTVNNTTLNADSISLDTTGDTNIRGANVTAESALLVNVGGDLNVESQQSRSRSKSTSAGVSGGFSLGGQHDEKTPDTAKTSRVGGNAYSNNRQGTENVAGVSGVNGGINVSNGMSLTRETVLSSLTSGGTADIKVKGNTQITGALIATVDAEGNGTDKLNFETGTLHFTDLRNTNISNQTSAGFSGNFALGGDKVSAKDAPDKTKAGDGNTPTTKASTVNTALLSQATTGTAITAKTADGDTLRAQTSNLTYGNSQSNSGSKTLATLGHGNITVGGVQLEHNGELTDAGKTAPSLIALSRDASTTEKTLWNSEQSQTVDTTLDHRLLTVDGRKEIKRDLVDTGEFGQDVTRAVITVNREQDLGVTDFFRTLGNNTKGTELKNDLLRNKDNAHIVEGLKSQDGDVYAQAVKDLGALAQGKFGFSDAELKEIQLYDSTATTSGSLQDTLFKDTKGGVVQDKSNAEYAGIFIDAGDGASKTDQLSTLGHETLEYFTLRTNGTNDNTQEAQANAFGDQLSNRINQAAGGDLDSTGGSTFNTSLKNSVAVVVGTAHANTVGNSAVDHRRVRLTEAQTLDKTREVINNSTNLTPREKDIAQAQLNALACSAVKCADGVPKDDPLYGQLKALQNTGEALNRQGTNLNTVLGAETGGQFEHDLDDSFDDLLTEHGEGISRTSGAGLVVAGALGMMGGTTMATAGALACAPSVGLSCAAVPVGVGITVLSEKSGEEGLHQALDPYAKLEGKSGINAFTEATHEGDINPSMDLAISLGIMGAEAATVKFGSKLLDRALDGKVVASEAKVVNQTGFNGDNVNSRADGDFGYLNQNPKLVEPITDPSRLLSNPARDSGSDQLDLNYLAPESSNNPIVTYPAPQGMRVNMAVHSGQIDPITGQVLPDRIGGFSTLDPINSVEQVHTDMAVKSPDWGPEKTHVQEFEIKEGTRVQESVIGPQIGSDGKVYVGGGNQVEPLVNKEDRKNVLTPIGQARPLPEKKADEIEGNNDDD